MTVSRAWPEPHLWRATSGYTLRRPDEGALLAWHYSAWRVVEVRPVPEVDLPETQQAHPADAHRRDRPQPYVLVLAHVHGPILHETTALHDGTHTIHLQATPSDHHTWQGLPEHYAVCVQCTDPHPCGEIMTTRAAANTTREMELLLRAYEPQVCNHCHGSIGDQPHLVFPEPSLLLPDAPGPTFHTGRRSCWAAARRYELDHRLPTLPDVRRLASCPGILYIHLSGSRECTAHPTCTGHHGPPRKGDWPLTAFACTFRIRGHPRTDHTFPFPRQHCGPTCPGGPPETPTPEQHHPGDHINEGLGWHHQPP